MKVLLLPLLWACASAQFTICANDADFRSTHKYNGVCNGVSQENCNIDNHRCELKWNDDGVCQADSRDPAACCALAGGTIDTSNSFTCAVISAMLMSSDDFGDGM